MGRSFGSAQADEAITVFQYLHEIDDMRKGGLMLCDYRKRALGIVARTPNISCKASRPPLRASAQSLPRNACTSMRAICSAASRRSQRADRASRSQACRSYVGRTSFVTAIRKRLAGTGNAQDLYAFDEMGIGVLDLPTTTKEANEEPQSGSISAAKGTDAPPTQAGHFHSSLTLDHSGPCRPHACPPQKQY
jgi:hypothetical protein